MIKSTDNSGKQADPTEAGEERHQLGHFKSRIQGLGYSFYDTFSCSHLHASSK